jgi:flagellar biosynthesis protein FlhF
MIVKKYLVNTIEEVQELISNELGPNAVILTSRQINQRGWKSLFFANKVQVVAAVDEGDFRAFNQLKQVDQSNIQYEESPFSNKPQVEFSSLTIEQAPIEDLYNLRSKLTTQFQKPEHEKKSEKNNSINTYLSTASEALTNILQDEISEQLPSSTGPLFLADGKQTKVAFVGPAGAGKTSALAKVAYQFITTMGKTVSIISFLDERFGAKEEHIALSQQFNHRYFFATNVQELEKAISACNEDALVLIDTMGYGFEQLESITEVAEIFHNIPDLNIQLVLDATIKESILLKMITYYSQFSVSALLFTKLDENDSIDFLLHLSKQSRLPLSYLVFSPSLIKGIIVANTEHIFQNVLSSEEGLFLTRSGETV